MAKMNSAIKNELFTVVSTERIPMSPLRKTSLVAGILYLLTFISIPTLALYGSIHQQNYILGPGPDTAVIIGNILEVIVALTGIGTAAAMYPVLKRQNEGVAMALVGSRVLEAATIFMGVMFLLTIVTLRQTAVGAPALVSSHTLVTMYDRMFLIGQSFMPAINDILLGWLLYQSRFVPRSVAMLALIGGPLLIAGDIGVLFGIIGQHDPFTALFAVPVAIFEFTLGIYLIVKGFNATPIDYDMPDQLIQFGRD